MVLSTKALNSTDVEHPGSIPGCENMTFSWVISWISQLKGILTWANLITQLMLIFVVLSFILFIVFAFIIYLIFDDYVLLLVFLTSIWDLCGQVKDNVISYLKSIWSIVRKGCHPDSRSQYNHVDSALAGSSFKGLD